VSGFMQAMPAAGEFEAVVGFMNAMESLIEYGIRPGSDGEVAEEFGDPEKMEIVEEQWDKVSHCWQRVLWAGHAALFGACDAASDVVALKPELANLAAEVARLSAAMHRARVHPDFTYFVAPSGQMTGVFSADLGWEPCPEADVAPGDECWRRRTK